MGRKAALAVRPPDDGSSLRRPQAGAGPSACPPPTAWRAPTTRSTSRSYLWRGATLSAQRGESLLGGATVLRGRGILHGGAAVTFQAVPYYAWANRGPER